MALYCGCGMCMHALAALGQAQSLGRMYQCHQAALCNRAVARCSLAPLLQVPVEMIAYQDLQFGKFLGEGSGALLFDSSFWSTLYSSFQFGKFLGEGSGAFEQFQKGNPLLNVENNSAIPVHLPGRPYAAAHHCIFTCLACEHAMPNAVCADGAPACTKQQPNTNCCIRFPFDAPLNPCRGLCIRGLAPRDARGGEAHPQVGAQLLPQCGRSYMLPHIC